MKKIICAFLSLVLLCSCSDTKGIKVQKENIGFRAHIFCASGEYLCDFYFYENSEVSVSINSGSLNGFKAFVSGEDIVLSFMGKESKRKVMEMENSVFAPIIYAFDYLKGNSYKVEEKDNSYFLFGESRIGKFKMYLAPTGIPIGVEYESNGFSSEFYDVTT